MRNLRSLTALAALAVCVTSGAQNVRDTTLTIKEAVVSASKSRGMTGLGTFTIPREMVARTPTLLGERDILKAVQLLPGVQSGTEGLSGLYVRGGGSDENLILLDGVPVHSPGHLLGIISAFQEDAVKEAVMRKGAFPARFGGRVSGVLEIKASDGDTTRTKGSLGVGLLSDKIHLEGSALRRKVRYSLSGRGAHTMMLDGAFRLFKVPANLGFHDLHAKVTADAAGGNRLSFSYFTGKDKLYYKDDNSKTDMSWGSTIGSAAWSRRWGEGLRSEITVASSGYEMSTGYQGLEDRRSGYRTGLNDLIAKADITITCLPGHALRTGLEAIRHEFIPESDWSGIVKERVVIRGFETGAYIEDRFFPAAWLTVEPGFRLSSFTSEGKTRLSPEPRVSATVRPVEGVKVQTAYSRVSQSIHQLSSSVAVLPVDLIVPVTGRINPVISDQISFGVGYEGLKGWEFTLEGYWKALENVLEYKDGVIFIDDFSTWEENVASGMGRSYGLEALIRKSAGRITGWAGYTLSKSERRFPDGSIGGGEWFPCRHDCRHSLSAVTNIDFGKGWDAGVVWTYSSGGAVTMPESDGSMPRRGNVRLPPSHRLDLGINHRKARRRGERIWSLGVYNAYNRKNPNLVFSVSGEEEDSPGSLKTISFLPIIPSVSYTRAF